jgi:hypothetical protein
MFAIDPQLVGTPATSKALSDFDDDTDSDDPKPRPSRRGAVMSGAIRKAPPDKEKETRARKDAAPLRILEPEDWRPSPEEYKKMSSKEKRQLRNKISARNFRVRRKGPCSPVPRARVLTAPQSTSPPSRATSPSGIVLSMPSAPNSAPPSRRTPPSARRSLPSKSVSSTGVPSPTSLPLPSCPPSPPLRPSPPSPQHPPSSRQTRRRTSPPRPGSATVPFGAASVAWVSPPCTPRSSPLSPSPRAPSSSHPSFTKRPSAPVSSRRTSTPPSTRTAASSRKRAPPTSTTSTRLASAHSTPLPTSTPSPSRPSTPTACSSGGKWPHSSHSHIRSHIHSPTAWLAASSRTFSAQGLLTQHRLPPQSCPQRNRPPPPPSRARPSSASSAAHSGRPFLAPPPIPLRPDNGTQKRCARCSMAAPSSRSSMSMHPRLRPQRRTGPRARSRTCWKNRCEV